MCKQSSSHTRRKVSYLRPKNLTIFEAFTVVEQMTESESINYIMAKFFAMMSPEQKQAYLSKARNIEAVR